MVRVLIEKVKEIFQPINPPAMFSEATIHAYTVSEVLFADTDKADSLKMSHLGLLFS